MKRLKILLFSFKNLFKSEYFGFIEGHANFTKENLDSMSSLIGCENNNLVQKYEKNFSKIVGNGKCISYASARMGFYELMRHLSIGKNDEVILQGATCAVMANAVLRIGATPVYSDIDPETYGSSAIEIAKCITKNTKIIVAQHSFGIPCDIGPIVDLAKQNNIFLLEDCALTLGSKIDGTIVGNFGDAALFSTDHSKPINTLIGGLLYTMNHELAIKLKTAHINLPSLSKSRESALFQRIVIESKYCRPDRYGRLSMIDLFEILKKRYFLKSKDFLSEDFGLSKDSSYPYPAKLPTFLAMVGLNEIIKWKEVKNQRKKLLMSLIKIILDSNKPSILPDCYTNPRFDIVPLRFAWHYSYGDDILKKIDSFLIEDWVWFRSTIEGANIPLELFGYKRGDCPVSENIGTQMLNMPCNMPIKYHQKLITRLKDSLK